MTDGALAWPGIWSCAGTTCWLSDCTPLRLVFVALGIDIEVLLIEMDV